MAAMSCSREGSRWSGHVTYFTGLSTYRQNASVREMRPALTLVMAYDTHINKHWMERRQLQALQRST